MPDFDPQKHHRISIRLRGWDYRSAAIYFVTICTHERQRLFDEPARSEIADNVWKAIPEHVDRVVLDEYVVMPNHLHGLLALTDDPAKSLPTEPIDIHWVHRTDPDSPRPLVNAPAGSLGSIVRSYKAAVSRRINHLRGTPSAKVWQRGYYERIVRDGQELKRIRAYIRNNPERWAADADDLNALLTRMTLRT
jgi:REP element-mobilizing transposase RayT